MEETRRQRYDKLAVQLEAERSSFIAHWRELGEYVLPRRPRFNVTDTNKGDKRNQKIIDSTATSCFRTLRSGMMSGVTSPARPWFRLAVDGSDSVEGGPIKDWLGQVTALMTGVLSKSNLYNALPVLYGDLGLFGTGAMAIEEDLEKVVRFTVFPIGSYCVSCNESGIVDTFTRCYQMTVRQIVEKFGGSKAPKEIEWENISSTVKREWEAGNTEAWIEVRHLIMPNEHRDYRYEDSKNKDYISVYYETATGANADDKDKFLRDSGYDSFKILVPRWEVNGEDAYGTDCPGMDILGDVKQLQLGEKRIAQAIDKMVNPPLVGPSSLRTSPVSSLPGDITYQDLRDGMQGLRPVHEVNPRVLELENKQEQIRQRIKHGSFEDLFLMLSQSDRREITAREIEERHEEKLWALGPVLERLNQDLLDPLIDIVFEIMMKRRMIPQPPPELKGKNLKVDYVSVMAQAQKLVGLGGVERFFGFFAQASQLKQEVVDKVDLDQLIDIYGDMAGIPPGIVLADDKVAEVREARSAALEQQQKMAAMQQGAKTAKDLSQADMSGDNALTQALGGLQQGGM